MPTRYWTVELKASTVTPVLSKNIQYPLMLLIALYIQLMLMEH